MSVTREAVRWRFIKKNVIFNLALGDELYETPLTVQIHREEDSYQILKEYGSSIRKMHIKISLMQSVESVQSFIKLVEEHCSETLVELYLNDFRYLQIFENITRPFKRVEFMKMGNQLDLYSNKLNFNEIFPSLRHMSFDGRFNMIDMTILNVKLPFLNHLTIWLFNKYSDEIKQSMLIELIEKNPQIKSIKLIHSEANMIKFIADHLPNLEHFDITNINNLNSDYGADQLPSLHFEYIKTFKVTGECPERITFGNSIEEFHINLPYKNLKFIDIIERYSKSLKILRIHIDPFGLLFKNDSFSRLIAAQLNIKKAYFSIDKIIDATSIIKFIESCKYLDYFSLIMFQHENKTLEMAEIIYKHFQNEWTYDVTNKDNLIIIFQKNV